MMRSFKYILPLSIALSLGSAFAGNKSFPQSSIKNFSGSYSDPSGYATADIFKFAEDDFGTNPKFSVQRNQDNLSLSANDNVFEFENLPEFIQELTTLTWSGISFHSNTQSANLRIPYLLGESILKTMSIEQFAASCKALTQKSEVEFLDEFLNGCLNEYGTLSFENFYSFDKETQEDTSLDSLEINTRHNQFTFTLQLLMKVKGEGEIYYNDGKIRLKITKARALFMNVLDEVFEKFEQLDSERVIVNRPWIEILVDEVPSN